MYNDRMLDIGPFGLAATKRQAAPLQLRVNQLAKRPGWSRGEYGDRSILPPTITLQRTPGVRQGKLGQLVGLDRLGARGKFDRARRSHFAAPP